MIYTRKCKTCNRDIFHKTEKLYLLGIERNGDCKKCAASKNIPEGIWEENGMWNRKCPTCNKVINYVGDKGKERVKYAHKRLFDCKECASLKRGPKSKETKQKISQTLTGRHISKEITDKAVASRKKLLENPEYRKKLSVIHGGKNNGMFGKHHSLETRKKLSDIIQKAMANPEVKERMKKIFSSVEYKNNKSKAMKSLIRSVDHCKNLRLAHIERIKNIKCNGKDLSPIFNVNACKIIDEYGKQNGYNFQHAMNGGEYYIKELGYWVDGYDKEKNIILEVDEKHHFDLNGNLKEKDIRRQKEIEEYLKCKFIRLTNIKEKE